MPSQASTDASPGSSEQPPPPSHPFCTGAPYVEREGGSLPGRQHVEHLPETVHRTGVWLTNQRQRRDRLDAAQLEALAALGVQWAR
ncbi:hypothetical protein [Streptomyces lavendulae]|uniref:hypothetical protein n=1 Tax=Streptomyces lavendulae TaxID=1914 RepID=UPI003824923E